MGTASNEEGVRTSSSAVFPKLLELDEVTLEAAHTTIGLVHVLNYVCSAGVLIKDELQVHIVA